MSVVVKVCGITNLQDAIVALEAGADALGFVFWEKSPRSVTPEQATHIANSLPGMAIKVGVFVDPDEQLVMRAVRQAGLNILQFHGSESSDFCNQFGLMSMKAFRVRDEESIEALSHYGTQAFLLDSYSPAAPGGTGEKFNWDLALKAKKLGRPIFLAGGLTPENVADAIRAVQPYGVDVSSGVEAGPGKKDAEKVRKFVAAAKAAARD